jgi:ABC-type glycerol-3-phosphate transport system permease component
MSAGRLRLSRITLFAVLWVMVLVTVAPFLYMLLGSFKQNFELLTLDPTLWPRAGLDFAKYADLVATWPILRNLLNSVIVSVAVTVCVTVFSTLTGYALAKYRFPGRTVLMVIVIATLMVPFETRLVPTYVMFRSWGLLNTYPGLIIPSMISAFGVFMIRQFAIESVPDELIESARLDGASEFRILRSIAAPLLTPALVSLALLTFIGAWNDFLWPVIAVTDTQMMTISVALQTLADQSSAGVDLGRVLAASVLSVIPVLVIFFIFNRKITEAVLQGSGRES